MSTSEARRLAAVVECDGLSFAIEIERIDRLALLSDMNAPDDARFPAVVRDPEGVEYVAWDLGELLGLHPCSGAWVVLRANGRRAVALRTGRCVGVRPLSTLFPLPAGVFARRKDAFEEAFVDAEVDGIGIVLNPDKLLTGDELRAAEKARAISP